MVSSRSQSPDAERLQGHKEEKQASPMTKSHNDPLPLPEDTVPPPLPEEAVPALPDTKPPDVPPLPDVPPESEDGWAPIWEPTARAYYFYNSITGVTQWDNPRVAPQRTGYDPAVHGDYDPEAWYAKTTEEPVLPEAPVEEDVYAATGAFNRFTGRWQAAEITPENHNDENKSRRQMNAYFDVEAVANSHDGRSLRAERAGKKLSKKEVKEFKEKRKARKEEKRRAWLIKD